MRSTEVWFAMLLLALALALWGGCRSAGPPDATAPAVATAPAAPPAEEDVATMAAVDAESVPAGESGTCGAGYAGEWTRGTTRLTLNPDGTGVMRDAAVADASSPLTWAEEGDHAVFNMADGALTGTLDDGGRSLTTTHADPGSTSVWTRGAPSTPSAPPPVATHTGSANVSGVPEDTETAQCLSNIRQLSTALLSYVQDYDEVLPARSVKWDRAISPYLRNESLFLCPSDAKPPSYGLNPSLLDRRLHELQEPARTAGIFESDDGRTVAYRHANGSCLGFVDGHVRWTEQGKEREPDVVWEVR